MPFEDSPEYRDEWTDACKVCFSRGGVHGTWLGRPCPNGKVVLFPKETPAPSPTNSTARPLLTIEDWKKRVFEIQDLERLFKLEDPKEG